jgi:hypothetical protein
MPVINPGFESASTPYHISPSTLDETTPSKSPASHRLEIGEKVPFINNDETTRVGGNPPGSHISSEFRTIKVTLSGTKSANLSTRHFEYVSKRLKNRRAFSTTRGMMRTEVDQLVSQGSISLQFFV